MSLPAKPKLRRELTWRRFAIEGTDSFIFKNELTQDYFKLDPVTGTLALQMDGTRDVADLLAYARATWPGYDFNEDYIADTVQDFKRMKFLDDPFETNAMVTARAKAQRAKINAAMFRNLLQIQMGAVNPDRFLARTYPRVRWFFTRPAVALGLALFIGSLYWIWLNRANAAGANYLALAVSYGAVGFACVWLSTLLVMFVHEFGHAYAVKHHGGRVDSIGFMLMFGLVAMYCDTSDSHMFSNKWHRVHVALAGTYTSFYMLPLATALWWSTPGGSVLNYFAYSTVVFLGVTTIVFNYNPLIKLDGYFVLADLLDMPSLQEEAFAYLGWLVRRHVMRLKVDCPVVGHRRKRILLVYGLLSLCYSIFFGLIMFLYFRKLLIQGFAFLGALASVALLWALGRKALTGLVRTGRLWALDHRGALRRHLAPLVAAAALALAFLFLVPVQGSRTLPVTLVPVRTSALLAPADMRLGQVYFAAGREVAPGDLLAALDVDSIALDQRAAEARSVSQDMAGREARLAGDALGAVMAGDRARAEEAQARVLGREVERASLRAPFRGRVLTESAPWRAGEPLEAGDTVCVVGDFSGALALARVPEFDLEDVRVGATVRVRLRSAPGQALDGRVTEIEPEPVSAGPTRRYRVWMALERPPAAPREGLTGRARIVVPARTPAAQVYRWVVRFVRLDLWV